MARISKVDKDNYMVRISLDKLASEQIIDFSTHSAQVASIGSDRERALLGHAVGLGLFYKEVLLLTRGSVPNDAIERIDPDTGKVPV